MKNMLRWRDVSRKRLCGGKTAWGRITERIIRTPNGRDGGNTAGCSVKRFALGNSPVQPGSRVGKRLIGPLEVVTGLGRLGPARSSTR